MNVRIITFSWKIDRLSFIKNKPEGYSLKNITSKLLLLFMMSLCFQASELNAQAGTEIDYVDNFGLVNCTYNGLVDGKHSYRNGSVPIDIKWSNTNNRWEIFFNADLLFHHDSDTTNPPSTSADGLPLGGWVDSAPDPGGDGTTLVSINGTGTVSSLSSPCNIDITSISAVQHESCPGANDGAFTVNTTCTSCTAVQYSKDNGTTWEGSGNSHTFSSLPDATYTIKVRDTGDNSCDDTDSQVINAGTDTTDPVITCPATVTIACDASSSPANTGMATATDNCAASPTITFTDVITPGTGNNSTITRTFTATDQSSNTATCNQTINVTDTANPVITCPATVTIACDASSSPANTGMATATDNCTASPTITFVDVITQGVGNNSTITRTFTATDQNSNSATCAQTINVTDTADPVITCPTNLTIACDASSSPANTGMATATDNCTASPTITFTDVVTPGTGNNSTISRTFTATDQNSNTATCTQTINVTDTANPVPMCNNITVTLDNTGNYTLVAADYAALGAGSTDNCSSFANLAITSSMSAFTCANMGTNNVTITITDQNSNDATCSAVITVQPPATVYMVSDASVLEGDSGTTPMVFTISRDNTTCSTTVELISSGQTASNGVDYSSASGQTVTLGAGVSTNTYDLIINGDTDVEADETVALFINPTLLPANATATNTGLGTILNDDCPVVINSIDNVTHEACPDAADGSFEVNASCGTCTNNLEYSKDGGTTWQNAAAFTGLADATYSISVREKTGGSSTCTVSTTQVINAGIDTTDPVPMCNPLTVTLDNAGNYTLSAANLVALGAGSTDNCTAFADLDITSSMSAFTCANIGTNNVTITVTDEANNMATCSANITVESNVTFSALNDLCIDGGIQTNLGGGTPTGGVYSGNGVTDSGNGMNYSFDPAQAGAGTHTITYTVGGCSALGEASVNALPPIIINATENVSCFGGNDGSIELEDIQAIISIINQSGDGNGNTLSTASCVEVDANDIVYVNGLNTGNVFSITPDGTITELIDATGDGNGNVMTAPRGLAVGGNGNVYVSNYDSHNAFKIEPNGTITQIIDSSGDGTTGLDQAVDVEVDALENVYVLSRVTHSVFKITPAGVITQIIGISGDGNGNILQYPQDLAVDSNNNIYVSGQSSDNVFKIEPNGTITEMIDASGDGTNNLDLPTEIVADASGNIFVAGGYSNNVFKIEPNGTITQIMDETADGNNNISLPRSIDIDSNGNIYVTGAWSGNVFKITASSKISEVQLDPFNISGAIGLGVDSNDNIFVGGFTSSNVYKINPNATPNPMYSIDGTNFQSSSIFPNLTANSYTITATDDNGCMSTAAVSITQPASAVSITSATMTSCSNGTDGEITVMATGGTGALMYSKDNGATYQASGTFSGLSVASYNIKVKDANDCETAAQSVAVTSCCSITINSIDVTHEVCPGAGDGTITINATQVGGSSMEYSISGGAPFQSSNVFTGQNDGTYNIVVRDVNINNCQDTDSAIINAGTDTTAPVAPSAPADENVQCAADVNPPVDLTANDNCDGNIIVAPSTVITPGACQNSFEEVRTWTFVDSNGNTSSVSQTIIVMDNTAPIAPSAPADVNVQCAADITPPTDLTANDNCDGDITVAPSTVIMPGSCNNQFTEVRTWTFIDGCGNQSSVSQTINVNDTTAPVAPSAPADENVQCAADVSTPVDLTANDNCDGMITVSPTSVITPGINNQFTEVRTWTFVDACGNQSSVSQTINVNDTTAPTPLCQAVTVFLDNSGNAMLMASQVDNGSSDNCGPVTLSLSQTAFDCSHVGTQNVTLTVTDENMNTAICTAIITVDASQMPTTIYVDVSATGNNDGSTWADAFTEMRDALDLAATCPLITTVNIAEGEYTPTNDGDRTKHFTLGEGCSLFGGFPTGGGAVADPFANPTILSGDLMGDDVESLTSCNANINDNSYTVAIIPSNVTAATMISGLSIKNGNSDGSILSPLMQRAGGGLMIEGSPVIEFITIESNCGGTGSGVYVNGLNANVSPEFRNCKFRNNRSTDGGGAVYNDGRGAGNNEAKFYCCEFSNNAANSAGGAVYNDGSSGGNCSTEFVNCTFAGNEANNGGVAMLNNFASPTISNSCFYDNSQAMPITDQNSSVNITNSIVEGNYQNQTNADPQFVVCPSCNTAVSQWNLALQSTSVAINAGNAAALPAYITKDVNGNNRIAGATIDIGAYENQAAALPVELMNFTVRANGEQNALLTWQTATETDNKGFEVQRSKDGATWEALDFVNGKGNSLALSTYQYEDNRANLGINYYRLAQTDYNGTITLSTIESVRFSADAITLYPNPTQNEINLDFANIQQENAAIRILDFTGKELYNGTIDIDNQKTALQLLDFNIYTAGVYFIEIQLANDSFTSLKFVKID